MSRRAAIVLCAAICVAAVVVLWLTGAFAPPAATPPPSQRLIEAGAELDEIEIEALFDPAALTLDVTQRLTLCNRAGEPLPQAVLRAWPNAFQSVSTSPAATQEHYDLCYPDGFSAGSLMMREALTALPGQDARACDYRYLDAARTALCLPLSRAWEPGETLSVTLAYRVAIPRARYRFGAWNGLCALGNAFAIPAVYEDGAWRLDEYWPVGDPFVSDCANYTVTVRAPEGWTCAGAGERSVTQDGAARFRALAVRDFALVLGEGYAMRSGMADGVLVECWARDGAAAGRALNMLRRAVEVFGESYGAYPYQTLVAAEVDFPFGGMEYPGLVMLGADELAAGGRRLEYAAAHETAHQWWYAAVGSDPVNQAWQDEALCEYAAYRYFERVHGPGAREELERALVNSAMRVTVPGNVTPGAPLDYFESMSQYSLVVYERGTALFIALEKLLGERLDACLRAYYERYAFARASREDFAALVAEVAGEDVRPLMTDYLDTKLLN